MAVNGKTLIRRFNDYCPEWLAETEILWACTLVR